MRFFAATVFLCAGVGLGVWGYHLWQQPIRMLPDPPPESRHGAESDHAHPWSLGRGAMLFGELDSSDPSSMFYPGSLPAQYDSSAIRMLPYRPTPEERRRERQQRKYAWDQAVKRNPACPTLMERGFAIYDAFRVLCRLDNSETPPCDQLRRRYHAASATVTAACQALPYSEARWAREEARRTAERERRRRTAAWERVVKRNPACAAIRQRWCEEYRAFDASCQEYLESLGKLFPDLPIDAPDLVSGLGPDGVTDCPEHPSFGGSFREDMPVIGCGELSQRYYASLERLEKECPGKL